MYKAFLLGGSKRIFDSLVYAAFEDTEPPPGSSINGDEPPSDSTGDDGSLSDSTSEVNAGHYTITAGSTIITLKEDYLKTLSSGDHEFRAVFEDGISCVMQLAIVAAPIADNTDPTIPDTLVPEIVEPLERNHLLTALIIAAIILPIGAAVIIIIKKRNSRPQTS